MKPPPTLHADLPGVIQEVLHRAGQPLNIAKLRSQLTGPYKVPGKLKDALASMLATIEGIHVWPAATAKAGPRYWTRDCRSWAESAMLAAAADSPVAPAKVLGAVAKQYGKGPAAELLTELIATGQLIRVPLFGGAKAKVCSRIVDEAAFRAELDAARAVIEAGYRRLTGVPAKPVPIDEQVLEALAALEPRKGLLVTAPRIHGALEGVPKDQVDAALLRLQDARRVILHRHSNPGALAEAERQELIEDQAGNVFVGACWRLPL
jgi:hypothetical protein